VRAKRGGRIVSNWRGRLNDAELRALKRKSMPAWTEPMLATLTAERFSSPDWIFECKLDGERCLVFRGKNRLDLLSRNRHQLNDTYPELADAVAALECKEFIADGEIVAFQGKVTSFSRLQQRLGIHDPEEARHSGVKVYLYLFDLLYLDGDDITRLPLRTRKQLLRDHLSFRDPLRFTTHRNEKGEALFKDACRRGWEGLIAKRADSPYVHKRSRDWLKFKCVKHQEFVIGGYTDPRGSRTGFGALLLGYYEDGGSLRYAGKVGTGFDDKTLGMLSDKLQSLERDACPYGRRPDVAEAHWVRPVLVAEVGFTEWTHDGRLRHPRFLGLRYDKPACRVVREEPV
jgi:bifunctional non-homologous end joining protein LigD